MRSAIGCPLAPTTLGEVQGKWNPHRLRSNQAEHHCYVNRAPLAQRHRTSRGTMGDMAPSQLDRLRSLCLALPETTERRSHGEPAWFIRAKRLFVTYADHHHDDRLAFWCAAPEGAQAELVASDPARFFIPPYVGHRGWLGVYLDVPTDWAEIAEIVTDAYRVVAPKNLLEGSAGQETGEQAVEAPRTVDGPSAAGTGGNTGT